MGLITFAAIKGITTIWDKVVEHKLDKNIESGFNFLSKQVYVERLTELTYKFVSEYESEKNIDSSTANGIPFYHAAVLYDELRKFRLFNKSTDYRISTDIFLSNKNIIIPAQEDLDIFIQKFEAVIQNDEKLKGLFVEENYKKEIFDISNKSSEIISKLEDVQGRIDNLIDKEKIIKVNLHPPKFSRPEYYIKRYIYPIQKNDSESTPKELYQLFNPDIPKKILLRAEACIGKSIELEYLAYYFITQKEILFYPVLVRLKIYVDQTIDNILSTYFADWQNIDNKYILLILDGYDEIQAVNREVFQRHLGDFITRFPKTSILVSTRNNFVNSISLDSFDIYELKAFDENDVRDYIFMVMPEAKALRFMDEALKNNNLSFFLKIPLYLAYFAELYNENSQSIPHSLRNLLNAIVVYRLEKDSSRKYERNKLHVYESISQKLAFALSLLGRLYVSKIESTKIFPSADDEEILNNISLINTFENISFKHPSFKEYFSALVLSSQKSFADIKQFITFAPDHNIIKPKWQNTISLLLELTTEEDSKRELVNFIGLLEPEILLKTDYNQISLPIRFQIFKDILFSSDRRHKYGTPYFSSELAFFAGINENPEVVEYLMITTLDVTISFEVRLESLFYLNFATNANMYNSDELTGFLEELVIYNDPAVQDNVLDVINNLKISTQRLNDTVYKIPNIDNYKIRSKTYNYYNRINDIDEFVDYYIEGIEIYENLSENKFHTNYDYPLVEGLSKMKRLDAIVKIIDYLIIRPSKYIGDSELLKKTEDGYEYIKFSENLKDNCISTYNISPDIFEKCLEYYLSLKEFLNADEIRIFSHFFIATGTALDAFWQLLGKVEIYDNLRKVGNILTEDIIDQSIKAYLKKALDAQDLLGLYKCLTWIGNYNLSEYLKSKLIEINSLVFQFPEYKDWDLIRENKRKYDLNLLLDIKLFKEEVNKAFTFFGSDELTLNQLIEYNENWEVIKSNYVNDVLIDFSKATGFINKSTINEWLNNSLNWEFFVINKLAHYKGLTIFDLPQKNIEQITSWCIKYIDQTDYTSAVIITTNSSWYYKGLELQVANFWMLLNFPISESKMLEMLEFDVCSIQSSTDSKKQISLSEIIIERINNIEKIKNRILQNLMEDRLNFIVKENHIRLCEELNITLAKSIIYNILREENTDDYRLLTYLKVYYKLNGNSLDFIYIIDNFNCKSDFHWEILNDLSKITTYSHRIKRLLEKNVSFFFTHEKIALGLDILIRLSSLDSLNILSSWIENYNYIPFSRYDNIPNLSSLPYEQTFSFVFKLLDDVFSKDIQPSDRGYTALEITFSLLIQVSLENEWTFSESSKRLIDLIEMSTDENNKRKLKNIYYQIEREYYIRKDDGILLGEVLALVDQYVN